ncbi:hypothetical protein Tco_0202245, partial [Tanacetum coccineum]
MLTYLSMFFSGRSLVSSAVYYEVTPQDTLFRCDTNFRGVTPATEEASTGPSTQPHDDTTANIVCESSSLADAKTSADIDKTNSGGDTEILQIGEEQGDD